MEYQLPPNSDHRPSPEAMLTRVTAEEQQARRGRLRIFFGAAPGVGKTYAMLTAARQQRQAGLDVVIGWIETHGRAETEALTEGFERLPPRRHAHRGLELAEFDLDAALVRRPDLLLVDELAHTNAPASRHARRWQDVEELLGAGLSVYTTLNVQHLEGLNDIVAGVTGIVVRETVPDQLLERSDEITLVDLTPDELLVRLREGKVYLPERAAEATSHFFRRGNLIALRDLALRQAARRVEAQVDEWRREQGVARPWATHELVLVGVSSAPQSARLIRSAHRIATGLRCPWIALSVERPGEGRSTAADRERLQLHLALAERLGGTTVVIGGEDVSGELLRYAREHNVTRLVVGKPTHSRWRDRWRGSLIDEIVRGSDGQDVLVTCGDPDEPLPGRPHPAEPIGRDGAARIGYLWALAIIGAATGLGWLVQPWCTIADQAMILLLGVVLVASRFQTGPAALAALASVAALDFFFVPPRFTFAVAETSFLFTFGTMFTIATLVSRWTLRIRRQAAAASEREQRTAAQLAMSRDFVVAADVEAVCRSASRHVRELVECDVCLFLADDQGQPRAIGEQTTAPIGKEVVTWVLGHGKPAGWGTDTLPTGPHLFLPLLGSNGPLGVVGVALGQRAVPLGPGPRQLLDSFLAQIAVALERGVLAQRAAEARSAMETERARNTLLNGLSHDIRTPLAAITGAAETLLDPVVRLAAPEQQALLEEIRQEGTRVSRLVADILELSRLSSGMLQVRKEWTPLEEVVCSALARLREPLAQRELHLDFPTELLLVPVDAVLLEQVFINLLENAAKYCPTDGRIDIRARRGADAVEIRVDDRGPGIPPGTEERVFERFYRVADGGRQGGTGLGLAICRAVILAHGGRIWATNRPGGGSSFGFVLPCTGDAPPLPDPLPEELPT